ncbi:MAG: hypothetical protein LBK50_02320 [Candidatus Nomurabacteria bacterium]|jgi:hypothetical protein|nr:hypothetical protein [Candidatus Nomurabacteria bacterium]
MPRITKIVAVTAVAAALGWAILPAASYAVTTATTTVNVNIDSQCGIGETLTSETTPGGPASVSIGTLNAVTLGAENTATGDATPMSITCNSAGGWELTEQMNTGEDQILNIGGGSSPAVGFGPWTAGTDPTATSWTANTWGAKYAAKAGGTDAAGSYTVATAAQAYHAVPANGSGAVIASAGAATADSRVTEAYAARTNGALGTGTYTGVVLFSLTGL